MFPKELAVRDEEQYTTLIRFVNHNRIWVMLQISTIEFDRSSRKPNEYLVKVVHFENTIEKEIEGYFSIEGGCENNV